MTQDILTEYIHQDLPKRFKEFYNQGLDHAINIIAIYKLQKDQSLDEIIKSIEKLKK